MFDSFRRRAREQKLNAELQACVEILTDEKIMAGMDPVEARRMALVELGGVDQIKEGVRETSITTALHTLAQDVRFGMRMLRKLPVQSLIAAISLAVGISLTTIVIAMADRGFLREPAGIDKPQKVVAVFPYQNARGAQPFGGFTTQQFEMASSAQDMLGELMAYSKGSLVLSTSVESATIMAGYVSDNFFEGLNVAMSLGRGIDRSDDARGGARSAVLSRRAWQRFFGGDSTALDKIVRLNGVSFRVIGVVSAFEDLSFDFFGPADVWVGIHAYTPIMKTDRVTRPVPWLNGLGRLRDDISIDVAQERLSNLIRQLPAQAGARPIDTARLGQIRDSMLLGQQRDQMARILRILGIVAGLILLAACFNVANFLLGHGVIRRQEVALRLVLGANRRRLIRQLMTEAAVLAAISCLPTILLTLWLARISSNYPLVTSVLGNGLTVPVSIDLRTLGFAFGLAILAMLTFGILPTLSVSAKHPLETIRGSGTGSLVSGLRRLNARQILLLLQVALVVVIAVTAGIYALSLRKIIAFNPGLNSGRVLLADLEPAAIDFSRRRLFYDQLLTQLSALPDVQRAAAARNAPLALGGFSLRIPGKQEVLLSDGTSVSPGYFDTMNIPFIAGNDFEGRPGDEARYIIVNQVVASRLWPDGDALGKTVRSRVAVPENGVAVVRDVDLTVVGIVNQPKCRDLTEAPQPCVYTPLAVDIAPSVLHIRTTGNSLPLTTVVRDISHRIDPDASIDKIRTLDEHLANIRSATRTPALVTFLLATVAISLVGIGCAAMFGSVVRQNRREVAIRMAFGADSRNLTGIIVVRAVAIAAFGIGLGWIGAAYIVKRIAGQLYQTNPLDPSVFLGVAVVVIVVSATTSYFPARTASKTDPASVLRQE